MRPLTTEVLRELLKGAEPPCISLYQPTHRANPDALQGPIRYKNLVRDAEQSLREKYSGREVRSLLERFQALAAEYHFWAHQRDGLAVLASAGMFEVFQLQRPVKELVVVADSFHLKPLLRVVQSADRYHVPCLDRHEARLFEGNRDALDEVDVGDMPTTITAALGEQLTDPHQAVGVYGKRAGAGALAHGGPASFPGTGGKNDEVDKDTERFFQVIDREVLARFSRPSGLPLILAALPEHHAEFRRVSRNPFLQPGGVAKHPGPLTPEQLRAEVWRVVEPTYLARLARLTEDHGTAAARGLAASDLCDVAKAVAASRVGVLLVEADRVVPGRFDPATGEIHRGRLADPEVGDVIDDLAEAVLRTGGEVVVVPAGRMPTDTGLAATFRH
ncbi:MAG TPA: hypothetical protein VFG68_20180 [Fimbriiglobus sp.]|nr:hypothetical protein [Fimbriiglobus sp.]